MMHMQASPGQVYVALFSLGLDRALLGVYSTLEGAQMRCEEYRVDVGFIQHQALRWRVEDDDGESDMWSAEPAHGVGRFVIAQFLMDDEGQGEADD